MSSRQPPIRPEVVPEVIESAEGRRPRRSRVGFRAVLAAVIIWCMLWGSFDLRTVLGGALVAVAIAVLFPLPPIRFRGRIRPWRAVRLVVATLADLVVSSIRVMVLAVNWRHPVRSAVVAVRLRTSSDLLIAMIVEIVGLVPGSVVVELIRSTSTIYVHVLDVRDDRHLDEARVGVRMVEERVIRAFGTDEEYAALAAGGHPEGAS